MAKAKPQAWMIDERDLEALEDLQKELRDRVDQANLVMAPIYTQFLNIVNLQVRKTRARFDREIMAEMRRTQRERKEEARESATHSEG